MDRNGRQLRVLISISILCCALLIGFNLFFVKEPAETIILTDAAGPAEGTDTAAEKININTATADELTALDGIGDTLAARIIAYREAVGGFSSPSEIMNVLGIGESTFAGIRDQIEVE